MKGIVQMAIGGVVIALVYFAHEKVSAMSTENETMKKVQPYLVPIAMLILGVVLGMLKNELVKGIGTWVGASGLGILIGTLVSKFGAKS
jgi:Na+/citrate or Na+/malate symporter